LLDISSISQPSPQAQDNREIEAITRDQNFCSDLKTSSRPKTLRKLEFWT